MRKLVLISTLLLGFMLNFVPGAGVEFAQGQGAVQGQEFTQIQESVQHQNPNGVNLILTMGSPFVQNRLSARMTHVGASQYPLENLQRLTAEALYQRSSSISSTASIASPQTDFLNPLRTKSGLAFLSSALLPGSAQLANGKPIRGALYMVIEAGALILHADQQSKARRKERAYESYANSNWSVVKYARWLVGYHDYHNLSNSNIEELRNLVRNVNPAFSIDVDWRAIPIRLLRDVERNTLYVYGTQRGSNNFSHVMPDYGSQQYYELISKYYQYGPGWKDFPESKFVLPWNGSEMSDQFYTGRDQAEAFNDHYRLASNMVSVLILNHVFSAFDAYFTVSLKNSRLQAHAPISADQSLRLTWEF